MTSTKVFGGYHAIALPLPHSSFQRFIYAKQHNAKPSATAESILTANRTAYVVNLPVNVSEKWLRTCLEPLGAVQHIVAGSGGQLNDETDDEDVAMDTTVNRTAHVVFKAEESLDKMLQVDTLEAPFPRRIRGLQGDLSITV